MNSIDNTERVLVCRTSEVAETCKPFGVWSRSRNVSSVQVWESVPHSTGRIGWQIWVSSRASWICLRIDRETNEEVDHYFDALSQKRDALSQKREEIDSVFGPGLSWDALEGSRSSLIRWDNPTPGGYRTDPEDWLPAGDALRGQWPGLWVQPSMSCRSFPCFRKLHYQTQLNWPPNLLMASSVKRPTPQLVAAPSAAAPTSGTTAGSGAGKTTRAGTPYPAQTDVEGI